MKSGVTEKNQAKPSLANPRKTLILRLSMVWLIVTVLASGLTAFLGFSRINGHIIEMLESDSEQSRILYKDFVESGSAVTKAKLEKELKKLLKQSFVRIQLYDEKMQPVMDLWEDETGKIREITDKYDKQFPEKSKGMWKRFRSDGREYIVLMAPILDSEKVVMGYFKAAYLISDALLSGLKGMIFLIVSVIASIILAVVIIVYPIVFHLNKDLIKSSKELFQSNMGMLKTLGSAIAIRDNDTALHNFRVTISSIMFAESLGLYAREIRKLIIGALLHDIGKIGIPDSILLKTDRLNDDEFAIMVGHVNSGLSIIKQYGWLKAGAEVVGCHHEKFDGSGYPNGLESENIPLVARVFAIIDVFDALTSPRPYKRAFTYEESIKIMTDKAGNHFDPDLLDSFLLMSESIYDICTETSEARADSEFARRVKKYFPEMESS